MAPVHEAPEARHNLAQPGRAGCRQHQSPSAVGATHSPLPRTSFFCNLFSRVTLSEYPQLFRDLSRPGPLHRGPPLPVPALADPVLGIPGIGTR
jgi:hypothetical protein